MSEFPIRNAVVRLNRLWSRSQKSGSSSPAIIPVQRSADFDPKSAVSVFIDNRFDDAIAQVMHYFDSGFLPYREVPLIFRNFPNNFERIVNECNGRQIEWLSFHANEDRPKLLSKLVIYPFNNPTNAPMVSNRASKHALLMHGESNKVAHTKPLARMYDYVLVAGRAAEQRLVEHGIFTISDIEEGRTIQLGQTVMGLFPAITLADSIA